MMPSAHGVWAIRGRREQEGELYTEISSVYDKKISYKLAAFLPPFPTVQEEESPWPDTEGCKVNRKMASPLRIAKSSLRKRNMNVEKRLRSYFSLLRNHKDSFLLQPSDV